MSSKIAAGRSRALDVLTVAAIALVAALYFVRLGAGSLWDNSEPQYAEIVKEMLRSGDFLTLHKDLQPWYIHPPLWFWTAAAASAVFGLNEFALRLPSAIFGVLGVWVTYAAARRLYGTPAAIVAALALGVSLEYLVMARLAIQETMLICFMSASTFWAYFAARDGDRRSFWIATAAAALGTLVKGPIAIVLPLLTVLVWAIWARRLYDLRRLPWLGGIAVYAVIAGAWFAVETMVNGTQFLWAYFGLSNVSRFLSPFENQPGPPYYYIPILIVGFFPFIAFVPQAIARAWRSRSDDGKFLLSAALVPFVFFSLAQTKLPNYIAIAFPALAVMMGATLGEAIEAGSVRLLRRSLFGLVAALAILAGGIVAYGRLHFSDQLAALRPSLDLLGWLVVGIAAATFVAATVLRRPWIVPWGLAFMMAAFIAVVTMSILPDVETTSKPMKSMAADVMEHFTTGDRICFDGVRQGFSLDYYTNGPPVTSIGHNVDDVPPNQYFASGRPALCVVSPDAYQSLLTEGWNLRVLEKRPKLWLTAFDAASMIHQDTRVGPVYYGEWLADVRKQLGWAPLIRTCPQPWTCEDDLTYTDGESTAKITFFGSQFGALRIVGGVTRSRASMLKRDAGPLRNWIWEGKPISSPPERTVKGWRVDDFGSDGATYLKEELVVSKLRTQKGRWIFVLGFQ